MDMSSREIRVPLSEVVAVLQDLNEFVVSLDRLGSRQVFGTVDEYTVGKFIVDWDVARRLARARRVIGVALDAQLSEEDTPRSTPCATKGVSTARAAPSTPPLISPAEAASALAPTNPGGRHETLDVFSSERHQGGEAGVEFCDPMSVDNGLCERQVECSW
ncbi:hypothetical protein [Streptomyces sp. NPDC004680]|uniref:hypothetical protein n=1 Tax=Streptomyces sp. NPDC004680 TaxID=3154287 RepID=UPI00339F38E7